MTIRLRNWDVDCQHSSLVLPVLRNKTGDRMFWRCIFFFFFRPVTSQTRQRWPEKLLSVFVAVLFWGILQYFIFYRELKNNRQVFFSQEGLTALFFNRIRLQVAPTAQERAIIMLGGGVGTRPCSSSLIMKFINHRRFASAALRHLRNP